MSKKAPGKYFRNGISLADAARMFADHTTAEQWFVEQRWAYGIYCVYCGSSDVLKAKHKSMPYRCRERPCGKRFSVRTKTVMQSSKLGLDKWGMAIFLLCTSLKSVSSMKLHRDLKITQKSAWYLGHRLRLALAQEGGLFEGPVEVDETFVGGVESNKHAVKKLRAGRGTVGKTVVAGARDRKTGRVSASVVPNRRARTLQDFVLRNAAADATIYTDDNKAYYNLPFNHEAVKHSIKQYVDGKVSTNGIESFWAMFKRAHKGTFHKISPKHLQRYVDEFVGRHNFRRRDTIDQMTSFVFGMERKRLRYRELVA